MARKNWRMFGMFFGMFILSALFYINYRVMDKETMFLPTYVVWAVWVGLGTDWIANWVSHEAPAENAARKTVFQPILALSVLAALLYTAPKVDLSQDWSTRQYGETILENAAPNALIFGWWDIVPAVQYLQLVENQRPDVRAINRFLISYEDLTSLALKEAERRPVYIDDIPPTWKTIFESQVVGEVSRIWLSTQSGRSFVPPTEVK